MNKPTSSAEIRDAQSSVEETVFIIEDDELQCELLISFLESAHFKVKGYTSPVQFLAEYRPEQRGCIISDILMPGMTGIEMLDALDKYNLSLPVIFITGHADVAMVKTALMRGAVDFFEKPVNTVELLASVQDALYRDSQVRARQQQIETIHSRLEHLTAREREILDLLVAGHSNKQLAKQLELSLRTVETHRNNILKKMGVRSFAELLRMLLASPDIHSA